MLAESPITLPHGLFDREGTCHRTAVPRPLTGQEELLLAEAGPTPGPREASTLLAACLERLGGYAPVDSELTAGLSRGDRHHLALHLRARLFGERIGLVVRCPNPTCGELSDVDLHVSTLAPERAQQAPEHLSVETPHGTFLVREPTGEDDATVVAFPGDHEARSALLWSLLVEHEGQTLSPEEWLALPTRTRQAVALALAEGSAAPDLAFLARCPTCAAWLELALEPFHLLARELASGAERLFTEVHLLAFHYHWSEAAILTLPRARRWRYLELLHRELEGRPVLDTWS